MNINEEISKILHIAQLNEVTKEDYLKRKGNNTEFLYHGTSLIGAYKIFESNMFIGKTDVLENGKVFSGVSTSRNFNYANEFALNNEDYQITDFNISSLPDNITPIVVFAFDKDKLKNNYKIVPFDYFYGEDNYGDNSNEQEEVIVGNINNVQSNTFKLFLSDDTKELLANNEIKVALLYQYYLMKGKSIESMEDDMYDLAISHMDEEDEDDWYDIGLNLLVDTLFPKINEFITFLIEKSK